MTSQLISFNTCWKDKINNISLMLKKCLAFKKPHPGCSLQERHTTFSTAQTFLQIILLTYLSHLTQSDKCNHSVNCEHISDTSDTQGSQAGTSVHPWSTHHKGKHALTACFEVPRDAITKLQKWQHCTDKHDMRWTKTVCLMPLQANQNCLSV